MNLFSQIIRQEKIEEQMLQFCGPIFWTKNADMAPDNIEAVGTFGLIDTGEKKLLVTCHHVWDEFNDFRKENPTTRLAVLLNLGFPIELNLNSYIDSEKECDLAVFDMAPLLPYCTKRSFVNITQNTSQAIAGDILAFLGYTKQARRVSELTADIRYEFFGLHVSDVSRFKVAVNLSGVSRYSDGEQTTISDDDVFGGLSGSPAYKLTANGELKLAAFVTSSAFGVLHLSSFERITSNGMLRRES